LLIGGAISPADYSINKSALVDPQPAAAISFCAYRGAPKAPKSSHPSANEAHGRDRLNATNVTSEEIAMILSISRRFAALAIAILGFAACLIWAAPVSAAGLGVTASCSFTTTTHAQCNIPVWSTDFNVDVHYVTAQCSSNTGIAFNLKQIAISAISPNGAADITYQVAGNRPSVGGVANAGAIVDIFVKINTTSQALIDFAAAPTGTTRCTVSLTATD
jgi:hypothetical protein